MILRVDHLCYKCNYQTLQLFQFLKPHTFQLTILKSKLFNVNRNCLLITGIGFEFSISLALVVLLIVCAHLLQTFGNLDYQKYLIALHLALCKHINYNP